MNNDIKENHVNNIELINIPIGTIHKHLIYLYNISNINVCVLLY